MQLSILEYAVLMLATHYSGVLSQSTPAQVVTNLNSLTQKSQVLQAPAQSITIVNGPLITINQGPFPEIIRGLNDIADTVFRSSDIVDPYPTSAQFDAILDAFRSFVRVHQKLLSILISKAGLLKTVPFIGQPVAEVVLRIQHAFVTYITITLSLEQRRLNDIEDQYRILDTTLKTCIDTYSGLRVEI